MSAAAARQPSTASASGTAAAARAPAPSRSPWQLLYGAVHAARRAWWRERAARLPRPVLSVGNLHFGGSGKTPMVAAIAEHLRDSDHRVCILSRGYGRRDGKVRIVSVGEGPMLGPRIAGDEPVLLAGRLPGVSVVVAADRARAGRHALERLDPPPDLFLLDDGFAHLRLARDLDILTFPASDPFAGGRLLPSGRLREPLAAVRHADAAVLTGTADAAAGERLARALARFGFTGRTFTAATRLGDAETLAGSSLASGDHVLVVAGIARPERFLAAVREAGFVIAEHLLFADHHRYTEASVAKIRAVFEKSGAVAVLTTGKDRVKLQGTFDLPLAELPMRSEPEPAFFAWLDERVEAIVRAPRKAP